MFQTSLPLLAFTVLVSASCVEKHNIAGEEPESEARATSTALTSGPRSEDAGADTQVLTASALTSGAGGVVSTAHSVNQSSVQPAASGEQPTPNAEPPDAGPSQETLTSTPTASGSASVTGAAIASSSASARASVSASATPRPATCGNDAVETGETCDDGNTLAGDGCSSTCQVETGWTCNQRQGRLCEAICGDGLLVGRERDSDGCDDQNTIAGDGCSPYCVIEAHNSCKGTPSVCDYNECLGDRANCSPHAVCTDTLGSFTCECKWGFTGNGVLCDRIPTPSCIGLDNNCGPTANESCCVSPRVNGDTYVRGGVSGSSTARVSDFFLDKYEVTVGRYRKFLAAYQGHPVNGAGKHPLIANSGWKSPAWDGAIAGNAADLEAALAACGPDFQTFSNSGANDRLPMNCVTWFEAFAFCAWDGGRLPTEAEWEYIAAGGTEQRVYPWGNTPVPTNQLDTTATYATYNCQEVGIPNCSNADILPVGSKPDGAGRWEHMDLAGSLWERTLDYYAPYPVACENCANLSAEAIRVVRGGDWFGTADSLLVAGRSGESPTDRRPGFGIRCARNP